jgi:uncharacterized membrane protein
MCAQLSGYVEGDWYGTGPQREPRQVLALQRAADLREQLWHTRHRYSVAVMVLAVGTGVVVIVVAIAVVLLVLIVALSMRGRQKRGAERRAEGQDHQDHG